MTRKRIARTVVIGCVTVASLGLLAGPPTAMAKKVTKRLSSCQNVAVTLSDNSARQVLFSVRAPKAARPSGGTVVAVVSVGLRISHTFDRDVTAFLVSPTGLVDALVLGRGDTGDNFGSGATDCRGAPTTFTDTAVTPIGAALPPFDGAFKPEDPLSVFAGSRAAGTWRVVVADNAPGDTGTLHAVSFSLAYRFKL